MKPPTPLQLPIREIREIRGKMLAKLRDADGVQDDWGGPGATASSSRRVLASFSFVGGWG